MSTSDWFALLLLHLSLSPLAIGGAMTLAPEIHRSLVLDHGWLSEMQFQSGVTLAQATPGPNVLYIALIGWITGLNAGAAEGPGVRLLMGGVGLMTCLIGVLLPSSALACAAGHWLRTHQHRLAVRSFRQGMAPIVVGVMLSTAWILGRSLGLWSSSHHAVGSGLAVITASMVCLTRVNLLWMIGMGALVGVWGQK